MIPSEGRHGGGAPTARTSVSDRTDELLSLLADEQRRHVLRTLRVFGGISVDRLAGHVGRATAGRTDPRNLHTRLLHVHLPKLDESGLVAFDGEQAHVCKREWPPLVVDLLDRLD